MYAYCEVIRVLCEWGHIYFQVDMSHYVTNNEYELRNISLDRDVVRYEMFRGEYPQVTMTLHIRRKPLYYSYTVVAPVIVSVSVFNTCSLVQALGFI